MVALSRTQSDLDSLSAEIDGGCEAVVCDLGDAAATQAAVEGVLAAGPCSLLINNAAIAINGPFLEATTADFDQLFAVNVRSVMQVSQLIAKAMIEAGGGGAIVNVSSQASMAALPDHTLYCSAKGALDMLTKMMALELGPHSIRVNSVHPTVVMTPMGKAHWDPETHPERAGPMLARIPLGHFAESIDVRSFAFDKKPATVRFLTPTCNLNFSVRSYAGGEECRVSAEL